LAAMVLLPAVRLLPLTVTVAVEFPPEAASAAVPRDAPPNVKVTLPVGAAAPLAGLTVAVN